VIFVLTVVFGALTVAGFAGGLAWYLDLASHFRVQYALILGVAGLAAALGRRLVVAGAAVALAVANLAVFAPAWDDTSDGGRPLELTVLVLNLDARNDDYEAVRELIAERRPDLFAAVELTPMWAAELEDVLAPYSQRLLEERESSFGLGLYSRRPLSAESVTSPAGAEYPLLEATVAGRSRPVRVVVLHPRVPATPGDAARHETLLRAAAAAIRASPGSGIVLGDLNTTPWSARFRELVDEARLDDTRSGHGLQASWPAFLPAVLRIPIDHVLVTPDLAAAERRVGPAVGSDHLPVWVALVARTA
jgi:endonuclease/exonuclease/phosphatase (EEP) superfamily protein YafD